MKNLITLFILLFCVTSIAGEKINKRLDVQPDGIVEIHNVRGNVDIIGWTNSQVEVSGTLDDLTEEFIFTSDGERTVIKVKLPRNSHNRSRDGSKLKIMLPLNSKVNFFGVATDLTVHKIESGLDINSVSGDIKVTNVKGRVYINSVSGNLNINALEGNLDVSTVSGNLKADVDSKKVNLSAVSADLVLTLQKIEFASLSTVSGDIKLSGALLNEGEISLKSVSGDAFYQVIGDLNARVSIETAPGGGITNYYSEDKPKSSFINSHNLHFTAGNGTGVIRMSTVSGNIGLKRP